MLQQNYQLLNPDDCNCYFKNKVSFEQGRIKTSGGPKPRAGLRHPGALTPNMGVRRGKGAFAPPDFANI